MSRKSILPKGQSVVSIRLPIELHDQLREKAEGNDRTVAQEVRRLISQRIGDAA